MPAEAIELFQSQCYLYRDSYTWGLRGAASLVQLNQGRSDNLALPISPFRPFDVSAIPSPAITGDRKSACTSALPWCSSSPTARRSRQELRHLPRRHPVSVPYLPDYQTGDLIAVFFTGLERDHPHPLLRDPVSYQILGRRERGQILAQAAQERRASGVRRVPARLHRAQPQPLSRQRRLPALRRRHQGGMSSSICRA